VKPRRRYLAAQVEKDLGRKMVFVAGPREVGKSTLARRDSGSWSREVRV
jgi:predicted AAA+ superfamily ATPase